jgi:Na+/proline symporter
LLFRGGLGLLIACVLAANMAACSAFMVDSGALFTRNIYARYLVRGYNDRHYLLVGRLSGLAITLIGVVYAVFFIKRVLYSFPLTETMSTFMGIGLVGGVFWTRANRWGALASMMTALGVNFSVYHFRHQRLDHWDPDSFVAAFLAGTVALVVASLVTPPEPSRALQAFYARLQASTQDTSGVREMETVNAPRVEEAEAGHQLILLNLFQLRKAAKLTWRTSLGSQFGCVVTFALVLLAAVIFHIS